MLLCPWKYPGKNTGMGCHALLQSIFPTQGPNTGLLHCRWIFFFFFFYHLSHKGRQRRPEWVACPISWRTSWPRNWTRVSCIAGGLFTNWTTGVAWELLESFSKRVYQWIQQGARTCAINIRHEWNFSFHLVLLMILHLCPCPSPLPPPVNNSVCSLNTNLYMPAAVLYHCTFQGTVQ